MEVYCTQTLVSHKCKAFGYTLKCEGCRNGSANNLFNHCIVAQQPQECIMYHGLFSLDPIYHATLASYSGCVGEEKEAWHTLFAHA